MSGGPAATPRWGRLRRALAHSTAMARPRAGFSPACAHARRHSAQRRTRDGRGLDNAREGGARGPRGRGTLRRAGMSGLRLDRRFPHARHRARGGGGGGGEIECPLSARCGNLLATACGCGEFSACPVFSNAIAIPSPYLPRGPRQPRAGFRCLGTAAWNGSGALPYRAAAGSGRKNTNSPRSSRPPTEGGSRNYFQAGPRPPTRYRPGPKPSDGPIHPGMQRPCRRHRALQGDPGLRPPGAGLQRWGERRNRRQPDSRSAKLLFGTVE